MVLYSFHQQKLTKDQWYERFNTKVDIRSAIVITRQHKVLLKYVTQESNIKYDEMSAEEEEDVKEDSKEIYLSYVFLRLSVKQHNKLNINLQNDFTTGGNNMSKKRYINLISWTIKPRIQW